MLMGWNINLSEKTPGPFYSMPNDFFLHIASTPLAVSTGLVRLLVDSHSTLIRPSVFYRFTKRYSYSAVAE